MVDVGESSDKSDLINLCYKNLVPKPQRSYRPNRRGQSLTQSQIDIYGHSPPASSSLKLFSLTSSLQPSSTGVKIVSCDRLKPPPFGNQSKCLSGAVNCHSMPKDRLKPPICSKSIDSNESKMIRLSIQSRSDEISAKSKNSAHSEAATKRSAASEADDRCSDAKQACYESLPPNGNQSKLFSISKSSDEVTTLTKKFTKITWP